MGDLEDFINDDDRCDYDPLVKMALIHHQFENIHPFSDGNGRIGRILNVLYLVHAQLLDAPILYLSCHIIRTKPDYYRLLRGVRDSGDAAQAWREWVAYMLVAVEETSRTTLSTVKDIQDQMMRMKHRIRSELPKIYSQELLNNLFCNPYTRIDHVIRDLGVSRPTASSYLNALAEKGVVREEQRGRNKYYINADLVQLLEDLSEH